MACCSPADKALTKKGRRWLEMSVEIRVVWAYRADALADGVRGGEVEGSSLHCRQLAVGDLGQVRGSHVQPACHHNLTHQSSQ